MKLSLDGAKNFNKCPRYYSFLTKRKEIPPPKKVDIFRSTVQKCYSYQAQGHKPTWRMLMGWVDTRVFKNIDVTSDEAIEKGRAFSESILLPLKAWYDKSFINEHIEGYTNVPSSFTTGGHQFHTIVPIIKLTDPVTAVIISDIEYTQLQLYNDIIARGTGLIVANQLKQEVVTVEHLLLGPSKRLDSKVLNCNSELNKRTERTLIQIANQVANKVDYPSITVMCNDCYFKKDCVL